VTLYVDSGALIGRYVAEDDSDRADAILLADPDGVTGRHAYVEVSLAIHRRLGEAERQATVEAFEEDWARTFVVALDEVVCRRAA
jgi:predicted nucleic acid-binding protein